jgi:two-component system, NarL family, invasion response regulator UvrY
MMIKLLIADDHPIVRKGLKEILSEHPDMKVLGEAQNSHEVLNLIRKEHWDVVVLDITMPGRDGLDVLKELKKTRPKLPVLVLSIHPEEQYGVRALKAGASGYLTKESAPDRLVGAIRRILERGKYVSPILAEKLAFDLDKDTQKLSHECLSDREYQVLAMIASGKTVGEIGQELSLSVKTVSTYRSRILGKMGMKNNAALTQYAIRNKLIE